MAIKLIAIDMDGTLLHSNHKISVKTKKTLQKAVDAGIMVVLATGRGMANIQSYSEDLNLQQPIVAANGADIYITAQSEGIKTYLKKEDVDLLHDLVNEYAIDFWGFTRDALFTNRILTSEERQYCLKFGVQTMDEEKLAAFNDRIQGIDSIEITSSSTTNIEINYRGVTKAFGVQKLCDHYQISMEDVMCLGDSANDLKLFEAVGFPVAMENAIASLKEIAQAITVSNDKDGVAKAIEKYALSK